jgi:hypothetical protein
MSPRDVDLVVVAEDERERPERLAVQAEILPDLAQPGDSSDSV